ncbi:MAG: cell division protein FtsQ [Pusillimonas sp.]
MKPIDSADRAQDYRVSGSAGGAIAAAGMALLMLIGFVLNLDRLFDNSIELSASKNNLSHMLDGTASRDFAEDLEKVTLPVEAARLQRAANWLLLGDLGPKVREGCTDWLFLTDELMPQPDGENARLSRLNQVKKVEQLLANQQIRLVIAVVPDKSRVMNQRLCALKRPESMATRAADWVAQLREAGVSAVDLTHPLSQSKQDTFLRTDTHWNHAGAALAAQSVATAVKATSTEPLAPWQRLETVDQGSTLWPGDLVRLAGIDWLPASLQPASETVPELTFKNPSDSHPIDTPLSEDDIFGDNNLPTITLIGSSFSRTSHFSNFLSQALETPVANLAKDGGGFSGAAHDYLQSSTFKETPPKLLIWEIPERDLDTPLNNDKALPL